ncbi:gp29 [Mycobacterium phage Barnyard]|uniref:Uncharacterized protein n=1 Tax=Mycobacterium phage Barnyard TaxID=205880 RepID=Q856E3_9CAUD|nr:gp29 [Mycobacterium phage Barnyard]AAN02083.1 hypothetical protein PBI_BARNYARD_29 [Mycobacterium phage Barnyard]
MPEIRCANKKFGVVTEDATGILEALCNSRFCGASKTTVIRHRWDLSKPTHGAPLLPYETTEFKRPK